MADGISFPSILNNSPSANSLNLKMNPLKSQLMSALELIKGRQATFTKFAFKQTEIEESENIKPLLRYRKDLFFNFKRNQRKSLHRWNFLCQ
jgi:hypothetical protein